MTSNPTPIRTLGTIGGITIDSDMGESIIITQDDIGFGVQRIVIPHFIAAATILAMLEHAGSDALNEIEDALDKGNKDDDDLCGTGDDW